MTIVEIAVGTGLGYTVANVLLATYGTIRARQASAKRMARLTEMRDEYLAQLETKPAEAG